MLLLLRQITLTLAIIHGKSNALSQIQIEGIDYNL
jgi:hypothetical protein